MRKYRSWLLCLSVGVLIAAVLSARTFATTDDDNDGIDDSLEQALAENFFPSTHYHWNESCPDPDPSPVIFRARYGQATNGSLHTDYIIINYVILYNEDCGFDGHNGDNEALEVWLQWNGSDWEFRAVSATAHWGATCEDFTVSDDDVVWISKNKHGNYADYNECSCIGSPCSSDGPTRDYVFYNAGEPDHHLLNGLGSVESYWSSEAIWTDPQFLSAGDIYYQMFNSNFWQPWWVPTPELEACDERAQERNDYCVEYIGDPYYCEQSYAADLDWCQQHYPGWDQ